MITFREWLDKSLARSWLSPSGELISVGNMSHYQYAMELKWISKMDPNELWEQGWFRVNHHDRDLYVHNEINPTLNYRQKKSLIDYAIESEQFERIIIDNGEKDVVIWSRTDI